VDPDDAYVYASDDDSGKQTWPYILRLLGISIGLGAVASFVSVATDRFAGAASLLLLIPGLVAAIGAWCYGIAFLWRLFQRSWPLALCWIVLVACVNGAVYVASHPFP
jgi:hypothetical protein